MKTAFQEIRKKILFNLFLHGSSAKNILKSPEMLLGVLRDHWAHTLRPLTRLFNDLSWIIQTYLT